MIASPLDPKQKKPDQAGRPAARLARALAGETPAGLSCADVRERLPAYVEAELRHAPAAQRDPDMAQHLLACEACSALHALMLERELAPAPAAARLPFPGVAAILGRSPADELQEFVVRLTQEILRILRLFDPDEWPRAVKTFFGLARGLGGDLQLQPAAVYAMGQGGALSPTACYLAVVFLATQALAQSAPAGRGAAQRTPGELSAAARRFALRAAEDMGLRPAEAARFAAAYARLVAAPDLRLPAWP